MSSTYFWGCIAAIAILTVVCNWKIGVGGGLHGTTNRKHVLPLKTVLLLAILGIVGETWVAVVFGYPELGAALINTIVQISMNGGSSVLISLSSLLAMFKIMIELKAVGQNTVDSSPKTERYRIYRRRRAKRAK